MVHGHGRGEAPWYVPCGEAVFVFCIVSLQHVSMFDYAGGVRAWTRPAFWYVPCGETVCVACREFATCVHASFASFAKSLARYTRYILVPQKDTEIALVRKPNATHLIIKYKPTSTLAIHSATLQSSL